MKRIALLIIAVSLFLTKSLCQVGDNQGLNILFRGVVLDAKSLVPIPNTQISVNRIFISVSGSDGTFEFQVKKRDSVIFKNLGYKAASMYISDTLRGQEFVSGVYLNSDTLSIAEVIIIPKYSNLKSEIMNGRSKTPATFDNARYNVAVGAYQGKTTQGSLGDPANNYAYLNKKQKTDAYERGGIPSDKILGLSPFMLIPAAYLLIKGPPDKPAPMRSSLTNQEIDQINQTYLEYLKKKK